MPEATGEHKTIAVIGEPDVVSGFRALGFDVQTAVTAPEALSLVRGLSAKGIAVCLIQDEFYRAVSATPAGAEGGGSAVLIPFGRDGRTALLSEMIKAIRLRATGTL